MKNTLKDIYRNIDLYGSEVFIKALKKQFEHVCYAEKSIPTAGSPAKPTHFIREDLKVKKAIFHKYGEITTLFICPMADGTEVQTYAKFF